MPINVVLGNEWSAGNLSYHLDSRPTWEGMVKDDKYKRKEYLGKLPLNVCKKIMKIRLPYVCVKYQAILTS